MEGNCSKKVIEILVLRTGKCESERNDVLGIDVSYQSEVINEDVPYQSEEMFFYGNHLATKGMGIFNGISLPTCAENLDEKIDGSIMCNYYY